MTFFFKRRTTFCTPASHYFLSIFHCAILSIALSALRYIIYRAQRTALYYLSRTVHCVILSIVHSALRYIIYRAQRAALYYLSYNYYAPLNASPS